MENSGNRNGSNGSNSGLNGNGVNGNGNGYNGNGNGYNGNGNGYNGNGNGLNGKGLNGNHYNGWHGQNGDSDYLPALREQVIERNGALSVTDLHDILEIVFKRKKLVLSAFLCIAIPVIYAASSKPPRFSATGKVLIKSERVETTVAPGENPRPMAARVNPATVNSEVQVLRSSLLMREVAERLSAGRPTNLSESVPPIPTVAKSLNSRVKITPIRDSNVIQVTYTSSLPDAAVETVNLVLDTYIDYHAKVHSSPRVAEFYQRQLATKRATLREAERKLVHYQTAHNIVDAERELTNDVERLARLENSKREVGLKIGELEEKILQYNKEMATLPETEALEKRLVINPAWEQLSKRLRYAQNKAERLRLRYTGKHRLVQEIDKRVEDATNELKNIKRYIVGSELVSKNVALGELSQRLTEARVELATTRAKMTLLTSEIRSYRKQVQTFHSRTVKENILRKRVDDLRASWDLFKRKAEEAQIAEAMDREQLVNVTIIDRPRLPLSQVPTFGAIMMAAAVVGALGAGIVLAFLLEFLKRSFRREPDLERYLGIPALGTVREF